MSSWAKSLKGSASVGGEINAGCAALVLTGPGALACGAVVVGATIVGSEFAKDAAGAVYDNVLEPGFETAKDIGGDVAEGVADGAEKVKGKVEEVGSFLGL
jgi:hypothetical protein